MFAGAPAESGAIRSRTTLRRRADADRHGSCGADTRVRLEVDCRARGDRSTAARHPDVLVPYSDRRCCSLGAVTARVTRAGCAQQHCSFPRGVLCAAPVLGQQRRVTAVPAGTSCSAGCPRIRIAICRHDSSSCPARAGLPSYPACAQATRTPTRAARSTGNCSSCFLKI